MISYKLPTLVLICIATSVAAEGVGGVLRGFDLVAMRQLMNQTENVTIQDQIAELTQISATLAFALDTCWVFITAVGILSMQIGFAILEAGTVQVKNVRSILMKNLMDAILGCLTWYFVGYGLFKGDGIIAGGDNSKFLLSDFLFYGNFVQQFGFAITSVTIVSGAVCSRIKFGRYVTFSIFQTGIIYPIAAHVCWTEGGFLYEQGFVDFAGSGVVHGLGGTSAIVAAWILGPRVGRFYEPEEGQKRGDVRPLTEHNAVLVTFGGLMLFIAWFAFNAGSSGGLSDPDALESAARAMITTLISASAAGSITTVYRIWFSEVQDIATTINGILAGLVAITGPCATVEPWAALIIGFISGLIYLGVSYLVLHRFHIDDPLHASTVHGACGMFGLIIAGFFDLNGGIIYGHGPKLLLVQLEATAILMVWAGVTSFIIFMLLTKLVGLRISEHDQLVGLDILYHQNNAYPEFDSTSIKEYAYTRAAKENLQRRNKYKKAGDGSAHSESSRRWSEAGPTSANILKLPYASSSSRNFGSAKDKKSKKILDKSEEKSSEEPKRQRSGSEASEGSEYI